MKLTFCVLNPWWSLVDRWYCCNGSCHGCWGRLHWELDKHLHPNIHQCLEQSVMSLWTIPI